jgi:hypothetical protein
MIFMRYVCSKSVYTVWYDSPIAKIHEGTEIVAAPFTITSSQALANFLFSIPTTLYSG